MKKKYTIKDIAQLAGVSEGTVDRVLHKRGRVSQEALIKVMAILDEIDYEPNFLARNLKNTKIYNIYVLMPDPKYDTYWTPCSEGITEAKNKYKSFNINIQIFLFNPTNVKTFIEANSLLLKSIPDAVLIVPFFYKEAIQIIADYNKRGIISCTFNNQLKTQESINFVGQGLVQSGRVAARLMDLLLIDGFIGIIHIDEDYDNANHMQEKEKGFRDYFNENASKELEIISFKLKYPHSESSLAKIFKENTDLKGIFITTSKAYQVASVISKIDKRIAIVGYDLLDKNLEYLKNKTIDFLINQNPKRQAYLGITLLIDFLIFGKNIPAETLLPIDIVNSENYHLR